MQCFFVFFSSGMLFFYYAITEQQIQRKNKKTMRVTNNNPKHTKLAYKIYTMRVLHAIELLEFLSEFTYISKSFLKIKK